MASANDAAHSMDKKTIGRQYIFFGIYETTINPANVDAFIAEAKAIKADSAAIAYDGCWFASQYNGNPFWKRGSGSVLSDANLKSVIKTLHDNNITVILAIMPQYLEATGAGFCKDYYSNYGAWYPKTAKMGDSSTKYVDYYYSEARKRDIDIIKYVVQNYDFDGIHIEEPGMPPESYASWQNVLAEHGYDPRNVPLTENVKRDLRHEEAKNMVLFFKELREGLTALGLIMNILIFQYNQCTIICRMIIAH